jgi:hypothetical protein
MAEHAAGFRGQRCVDRQRIRLAQEILNAGGPSNAERKFGAVRQIRIEENHVESKRAGAQRNRRADPTETDDAKGLHAQTSDQLALYGSPGRRRVLPLPLVIEDDTAAQ